MMRFDAGSIGPDTYRGVTTVSRPRDDRVDECSSNATASVRLTDDEPNDLDVRVRLERHLRLCVSPTSDHVVAARHDQELLWPVDDAVKPRPIALCRPWVAEYSAERCHFSEVFCAKGANHDGGTHAPIVHSRPPLQLLFTNSGFKRGMPMKYIIVSCPFSPGCGGQSLDPSLLDFMRWDSLEQSRVDQPLLQCDTSAARRRLPKFATRQTLNQYTSHA
ncbi:MAG TPA: hypothetical protein VGH28_29250 [Polyangiaceae bacterium]|jgi:hypothetical protein